MMNCYLVGMVVSSLSVACAGLEDLSFEEARLDAYVSAASGDSAAHVSASVAVCSGWM